MWCSWLASWRPAVAWPAAAQLPGWLAGRKLAHRLTTWLMVERINMVTRRLAIVWLDCLSLLD